MSFFHKNSKRIIPLKLFLVDCIFLSACFPTTTTEPVKTYGNIVVSVFNNRDAGQEIKDFIIRVEETNEVSENDNEVIKIFNCSNDQHITAWPSGYYIKTVDCITGKTEYNIPLDPITFSNNTNLSWISAGTGNEPQLNCIFCHNGQYSQNENEFQQWII